MASLKPFAALLPKPELAAQICELPYDVMSSEEAREMARNRPLSFLHVSKPEIDLPPGIDLYGREVYARGRENFERMMAGGSLVQDSRPAFYLYRQIMGAHAQVGLVAAASCEEYIQGTIKKHEFTRPDKEDDRVRHIEALNAQTGPVFLTYRASEAFDGWVRGMISKAPDVDFTAQDGVRHTSWRLASAEAIQMVESTFSRIPTLYIADGHHRSAAAARVFQSRHGAGQSSRFLAVVFPHNQMQILPYNRVLKDLNGLSPSQVLERLAKVFDMSSKPGHPVPARKHEVGFYFQGAWRSMVFRQELTQVSNPVEGLDVSLLQKHVLAPVFGVDDPRTSKRIQFVGGIRGSKELERLVDHDGQACAFSMFPTSIEDLMSIADEGGIMPPKSTWFEPKLRDAMFCHRISQP